MIPASLPRAAVVAILLLVAGGEAAAQAEFGAQLDLFSSYVWRGVTLTNKPVAQPDVWVSVPAGNASITAGGWASIDIGKYDDPENDISESGGLSAFNFAEFDPYAEVSFPAGKATVTAGITGYLYPNDTDLGLNSDFNTWELYGKVGLDTPLAPEIAVYYDIDKVNGAYFEGAIAHSLPLGPTHTLDLGALAGLSAGQDFKEDSDDFANFEDNGLTHVDLSASLPLTAGAFSITPVVHFQINVDEATKFHSPSVTGDGSDVKVWGGVSLGWSNAVEEPAPEAQE